MSSNYNALIATCNQVLDDYECAIPAIKGIRNLSRSDLETAILYAETISECGNYSTGKLMPPRGGVEALLKSFCIL